MVDWGALQVMMCALHISIENEILLVLHSASDFDKEVFFQSAIKVYNMFHSFHV